MCLPTGCGYFLLRCGESNVMFLFCDLIAYFINKKQIKLVALCLQSLVVVMINNQHRFTSTCIRDENTIITYSNGQENDK